MSRILYIGLVALVTGCTQSVDDRVALADVQSIRSTTIEAPEYAAWIESNGASLTRTQVIGDLTYTFTRVPAELLAIREAGADASEEELKEARSHYSELMYFRLRITAAKHNGELLKMNVSDAREYDRRVKYAAFGIQKDITMEIGSDVIPCALCEFERSFDVAPVSTFLLAFEINDDAANLSPVTLVFNDQLFNNGIIRFAWNKAELNAYPSLKGTNL